MEEVEGIAKIIEKKSIDALSLLKSNSIYFAHPINIYNTSYETELLKNLENLFPESNIENPNQKHHSENYHFWRDNSVSGMNYFLEVILPSEKIIGGVYLPFGDGMIGAGIFKEMKKLEELKKPIYEYKNSKVAEEIKVLDESRKLSVEETRERVYKKWVLKNI